MAGTTCTPARAYLDAMQGILQRIDTDLIDAVADAVFDAWKAEDQVLVFGNGGSAYTASHLVLDLVKTAATDGQRRLRAISLVDNYGVTTALANDTDYGQTFSFPLETYGRPGDLAIAISGSGQSPNVVNAAQSARERGLLLVGLTGFDGGTLGRLADYHVNIPSENYGLIEDLHLSIGHIISQILKSRLQEEAICHETVGRGST